MKLTARQTETAKPSDRDYTLSDGNSLFLIVKTNGAKYWRYRYRINGIARVCAIGVYPEVSLAQARQLCYDARKLVAAGTDPVRAKHAGSSSAAITFESVAREWHEFKTKNGWSANYSAGVLRAFDTNVFGEIGSLPVADTEPASVLAVLRKIENRGATLYAQRIRGWCNEVFRYAVATGRAKFNPASELGSAMANHESRRFASLQAHELPGFLRAVDSYGGSPVSRTGVRLLLLCAVRTAELRHAQWDHIDLDNAVWEIPAALMKSRRPHIVPLSRQAVTLLRDLQPLTGRYANVFPCRHDPSAVMSPTTITGLIGRTGYAGRATGHGFRHTFSTICNEHGFNRDWIEMQLAHADRNPIRGTYNHALYLDGRRQLLQWYADFIDGLCG